MVRRLLFAVIIVSALAAPAFAADDNEALLPAQENAAPAGAPSYFEGTWVGIWPGYRGSATDQDVSITVVKGRKEGYCGITYSWGTVNYHTGSIPAGTMKTWGKLDGDKLMYKWKNKQGREFEVTLQKYKEDVVKARLDRLGPLPPGSQPYTDTYLNRKQP